MPGAGFDVVGVGNAIVDVLAKASETQVRDLGLAKGSMTLVDAERADALYARMGSGTEVSGGSAANTVVGVVSLGGRGSYIGKVGGDQLGSVFQNDIRAAGVDFRTSKAADDCSTARCLIFVTPDAQRTMQTYLGVSVDLGPDDIDAAAIRGSAITYLEGYLFDREPAKAAFVRASEIAHAEGKRVALSLSDPLCVERHRASFLHLVSGHVDILFANEAEVISLFEVKDFAAAVAQVRGRCEIAALTRGPAGSLIVAGGTDLTIAAEPVERVVDTTGAGDLYAAGVLFGLTRGYELETCGRLGAIAAAEVIGHYGARPQTGLATVAREKLG